MPGAVSSLGAILFLLQHALQSPFHSQRMQPLPLPLPTHAYTPLPSAAPHQTFSQQLHHCFPDLASHSTVGATQLLTQSPTRVYHVPKQSAMQPCHTATLWLTETRRFSTASPHGLTACNLMPSLPPLPSAWKTSHSWMSLTSTWGSPFSSS
jgi:hypothetical protein